MGVGLLPNNAPLGQPLNPAVRQQVLLWLVEAPQVGIPLNGLVLAKVIRQAQI